jgi:dihydropyrimidinase
VFSSDHAPYRYDESGKLPKGDQTTFKDMANGVPGIELRMPLLYSEGVHTGRMTLEKFVALTATDHAQMYGLSHRKGRIAVGLDADIAVWDPLRQTQVSTHMLHDRVGYTPYEGRTLTGWPTTVVNRGRVVIAHNELQVARGSGEFIARGKPGPLVNAPASTGSAGFLKSLLPKLS